MGINPWLDKFKKKKRQVERLKVQLFCYTMAGERRYYSPSKPVALSVVWAGDDFLAPPHVSGIELFDDIKGPLWFQNTPQVIILKDGITIEYDLSKITVDGKWTLADFLVEDDS